ncbi:MAG: HD-GYP domain-containing protein, partial [Cyanobacteria bacterium REEB65]|nr:HD-GYP domain-containing protein [Cyanobacteria bacterium REEB65]
FQELRRVVRGQDVPTPEDAAVRVQERLSDQFLAGSLDAAALESLGPIVHDITRELLTNDLAVCLDLRTFGDYEISHPANVFQLVVQMGYFLGYSRSDLAQLGTAALLHDIGNAEIDPGILNSSGPLTAPERQLVERHAMLGADRLARQGLGEDLVMAVRCHHERLDGSGYPLGLEGDRIPEWAGILAVADTYDAMLSENVYKRRLAPSLAYQTVVRGSGKLFDPKIVAAFQRHVVPYPVGSQVRLSSGAIGTVVEVDPEHVDRPVVRVGKKTIPLSGRSRLGVLQAVLPRRFPRRGLHIPAACYPLPGLSRPRQQDVLQVVAATVPRPCEVVDLSRVGACLQASLDLGVIGRWLLLEISGRDGSVLRWPAKVQWAQADGHGCRIGISFETLTEAAEKSVLSLAPDLDS